MNKKGFTLVELLAVIVILAIIAVIATPMILNVIENSKKGAAEASANGYTDAIEKSILEEELKGNIKSKNKVYRVEELDFVNIKGDKPIEGYVKLKNGTVDDYELKIGDYIVRNKEGKAKAEKGSYYLNGTAIYFNPVTGEKCDDYQLSNSETLVKEGCMKWYIFNDSEDNDTVNMILDHNTTKDTIWNSTDSVTAGMEEVVEDLKNDTDGWLGVNLINSTIDNFDYTGYRARLITAYEIAEIVGKDNFTTEKRHFKFAYYNEINPIVSQGTSKYAWLYDNTIDCVKNGCNFESKPNVGFYTSTPVLAGNGRVYVINKTGDLWPDSTKTRGWFGVRPVIEVSKDKIK